MKYKIILIFAIIILFSVILVGCVDNKDEKVFVSCISDEIDAGKVLGGGIYKKGSEVTIKAKANEGYEFVGWNDGKNFVSVETTYVFLAKSVTIKAVWRKLKYSIQIVVSDSAAGQAYSDKNIYEIGETALLSSETNSGFVWDGWRDGDGNLIHSDSVYQFVVTKHRIIYAKWSIAVSNIDDLRKIENASNLDYALVCDIDLAQIEWDALCQKNDKAFTGTLDGRGFRIKNLHKNVVANQKVEVFTNVLSGLFGYVEGKIINLNIENFSINTKGGRSYSGAIAAVLSSRGKIINCKSVGDITVNDVSWGYAGAIAGSSYGLIKYCHSNATIKMTSTNGCVYGGGLVGEANFTSKISISSSIGYISAIGANAAFAGGLIGVAYDSDINNCYSSANTYAKSIIKAKVGGFLGGFSDGAIGIVTINNSYSSGTVTAEGNSGVVCIGGFAGENKGAITNCFAIGNVTVKGSFESDNAINCGAFVGAISDNCATNNCYATYEQKIDCLNNSNNIGVTNYYSETVSIDKITMTDFLCVRLGWQKFTNIADFIEDNNKIWIMKGIPTLYR